MECSAYESINSHYLAARKHKKNIAFLISLTGSNHTVICMAKYLREATETYVVGIAGPYHTELKKWCHEIVEIPNRDALLSLDVITSFSGATYILDIFFALLLSCLLYTSFQSDYMKIWGGTTVEEGDFRVINGLLYYIDFETMEGIPICNKPNCRHISWKEDRNTKCDAANIDISTVFPYEGKLYGFRSLSDGGSERCV